MVSHTPNVFLFFFLPLDPVCLCSRRAQQETGNWSKPRRQQSDLLQHDGWWRGRMATDEIEGFWVPPQAVSFEQRCDERFRAYRKQLSYALMWQVGGRARCMLRAVWHSVCCVLVVCY